MIWVAWRQQRAQLITLAVVSLVVGTALAMLHWLMLDDLHSAEPAGCWIQQGISADCRKPVAEFQNRWFDLMKVGQVGIIALPGLIGLFLGAPMFARDLEQGTHVLAFTQSVGRARWMVTKLLVGLVPALSMLLVLQWLVSRWLVSARDLGPLITGPYEPLTFVSANVTPLAFTLFVFCLGAFLGALTRRTLSGMTITLGVFVAGWAALLSMRTVWFPPVRVLSDLDYSPSGPEVVLSYRTGYVGAQGQEFGRDQVNAIMRACDQPGYDCWRGHGLAHQFADVLPAADAWKLHLVEGSVCVALAAALVIGTFWVLRGRV
ncbi:hypothetical protein D5S17_01025 [Pseudonocardiaceae bacterium YIM PH 21723]|nr:hypothetical protein D5S17_01025 [Pseudonocardiaceae bacterium YIM PH 21723]